MTKMSARRAGPAFVPHRRDRAHRASGTRRAVRAARVARGLRMLRLVRSLNRGMNALGASLGRRGFAYVVLLSFVVLFAGAAGIYGFEYSAVKVAKLRDDIRGLHGFASANAERGERR